MLSRIDAALPAHFQKHPQRDFTFAAQTFNICRIKFSATVQTQKLSAER
jgi:hypothetical protein